MARPKQRPRHRLGRWELLNFVGRGGNGQVWRARSDKGEFGAIKVLHKATAKKANQRFRDEVQAMRDCAGIKGVLPLLDAHLPDPPTKQDRAWLVSALAVPLDKAVTMETGLEEAVRICLSLATTLAAMHFRGYSHRDIKPNNVFLLNGAWCLGDFGLVDFPDKGELTRKGEKLGPALYIAPEMLNEAADATGAKADVYSLGKLLWKLGTGQRNPLPGTHSRNIAGMTISGSVRAQNTVALDALVEAMTLHEHYRRPTMAEVCCELEAWLAPVPMPTRMTDLAPFTKRARVLTEVHVEGQRRRTELQAEADKARAEAFARFRPVIEAIKRELETAGIGTVSIEAPAGGNGEFYHAVTGKQEVGRSDRTSLFQHAVSTRIDGGKYRGRLQSGLNLGIRNVEGYADTLHDIHLPVLAAAGHIVTLESLFGGSWRSFPELTWGDHDTFVLGQPREGEVLARLGAGLTDNLTNAVGKLIAGMEAIKLPRNALAVFDVTMGKQTLKVIVSEQRHLDGIAAARARHNEAAPANPIETNDDYVQFVLSHWLRGDDADSAVTQHNDAYPGDRVETPQRALQATLDRAVESYWKELVVGGR
jgi:Protein kinase domain